MRAPGPSVQFLGEAELQRGRIPRTPLKTTLPVIPVGLTNHSRIKIKIRSTRIISQETGGPLIIRVPGPFLGTEHRSSTRSR